MDAVAFTKERTVDEILKIVNYSKLKESDISPDIQVLSFASNVHSQDMLLIELDENILRQMKSGVKLTIRGDGEDSAVVCTDTTTYSVKEAETSNSLLLTPTISWPNDVDLAEPKHITHREVTAVFHTYLELTPCKPRLQKLRELLEVLPYCGSETENSDQFPKFTLNDLLNKIQASETELAIGLKNLEAYLIDGYWHMLDFQYHFRVLNHILNLIEENSWEFTAVPKQVVLNTLEELESRAIVEQCFDYYFTETGLKTNDGHNIYKTDEEKVCRFFACAILKPTTASSGKTQFNFQEFLESWQLSVPNGMKTDLKQLQGLALVDRNRHPHVITYYPSWGLPEEIGDRFNCLFKERAKWNSDDIKPFLQELATDQLDVNALLTKYARVSTQDGKRYYTSKRPIV